MAAGEYISMQSQRELFERQIELERAELEAMPDEEQRELAALYMAKGFSRARRRAIAQRMFQDPETALDTLVREELGLDPDELGSPWGAAIGSFLAFAIGASIPVIPYLFASGTAAFVASASCLSLVALFAGRRRRQPPDRPRRPVLRARASSRSGRGGGGHLRRRHADRRRGAERSAGRRRPGPPRGCGPRGSTRAPGRTARATATRP